MQKTLRVPFPWYENISGVVFRIWTFLAGYTGTGNGRVGSGGGGGGGKEEGRGGEEENKLQKQSIEQF